MSDMSAPTGDVPANNSGKFKSLAFGFAAVVLIVLGLARTWQGVSSLFGWDGTSEFNSLLEESDAAYKEALKQAEVAEPLFKSVMESIDAQPLEDARLEQGENAKQAIAAFKEAATQFAASGKKIDDALTRGITLSDEHTQSLKLRSQACALLADVCQQNADICALALDESFATKESLVAKVLELAAKRDVIQQEADAAIVESEKLAKQVASE